MAGRNSSTQRGVTAVIGVACVLIALAGCEGTPRRALKYPEGTIPVRYEEATSYSTCLVASVAMAGNHLLGERRFSETGIVRDLRRAGLDETRVGDLKRYLDGQGLHLVTLRHGRFDDEPPLGLRYWIDGRGYPAICIINRDPEADPAFNHAVVVIGISSQTGAPEADIIHYIDPSTEQRLHSDPAPLFEMLWTPSDRAMLLVVEPP